MTPVGEIISNSEYTAAGPVDKEKIGTCTAGSARWRKILDTGSLGRLTGKQASRA
jgi:hypothetical protein